MFAARNTIFKWNLARRQKSLAIPALYLHLTRNVLHFFCYKATSGGIRVKKYLNLKGRGRLVNVPQDILCFFKLNFWGFKNKYSRVTADF